MPNSLIVYFSQGGTTTRIAESITKGLRTAKYYGYVLNGMGWHLEDPREVALRAAMYRSIGKSKR